MTLRIMGDRERDDGRFRVVRRIGRGGMAETFECIHERASGRRARVCVKRILPAYRGDAEIRRLFEEEGRLSLDLRHQNIVRAIAAFEDDEGPGLAFELVEGASLRELIDYLRKRGGALSSEAIVHIALSIARGLDYIHRRRSAVAPQGIVHRDITPSNLLLDQRGKLRISDFGIARSLEATTPASPAEPIRGKLPYLAPEYARGEGDDPRSDLYSLGVVIYELIALRHPERGESLLLGREDTQRQIQVLATPRPSLILSRGDLPQELRLLVDSLLARERESRPESAERVIAYFGALGREGAPAHVSLGKLVSRCHDARPSETLERTEMLQHEETTVRLDLRAS